MKSKLETNNIPTLISNSVFQILNLTNVVVIMNIIRTNEWYNL